MKITKAQGEGHGQCTLCKENGRWNVQWMCFLYEVEGKDGVYCKDCIDIIRREAAIEKLKAILAEATETENAVCYVTSDDAEDLKAAIVALEQPPIDRIRKEIESYCTTAKKTHCKYCSRCNNMLGIKDIIKIIDKHIAESSANKA